MNREKGTARALGSLLRGHARSVMLILVLVTSPMTAAVTVERPQRRLQERSGGSAAILQPGPSRPLVSSIASIQVSFRLDPWLLSGNYGSGFWASPPVLGPATQPGNTFAIEIRAAGLDDRGQVANIIPRWTASDPAMVQLSSNPGASVTLLVRRAGQSSLRVDFRRISKVLSINAVSLSNAMQVEISQK